MVEVVNVVASGSLGVELDLERLSTDIGAPIAQYDPDKYPGIYIRLSDEAPLITLYRTGKSIITGAGTEEDSNSLRRELLSFLSDMGVIEDPNDEWFSIQNYVCTAEVGSSQNLNALAIGLGLENTEYEPEQFPGLVYRPPIQDCVVLIFANGRVVLTGAKDILTAEATFKELQQELSDLV